MIISLWLLIGALALLQAFYDDNIGLSPDLVVISFVSSFIGPFALLFLYRKSLFKDKLLESLFEKPIKFSFKSKKP